MVIEFISLLLTTAELILLFLKGMTGALAPFSYLELRGFQIYAHFFSNLGGY
jgi:hypothetical protein